MAETLHHSGDSVQVWPVIVRIYFTDGQLHSRPNADAMKPMKADTGEGVECVVLEFDNVPDGLDLDTEGRMEDHDGVSLQIVNK